MGQVSYRPKAELDLDEAFDWYVENASLEIAQRFFRDVFVSAQRLSRSPGMGSPHWQWLSPKLAHVRVGPVRGFTKWLIFYLPTDDGIEVLRVLHGARDIESELPADM